MTRVLVVGDSGLTRSVIRHLLGHQQLDLVGLVVPGDPRLLGYTFRHDSGASAFRGSVSVEPTGLVLAGRYGRGGVRHDSIPLLDAVPTACVATDLDAVVVAEDWSGPEVVTGEAVRVVDLRGVDGIGVEPVDVRASVCRPAPAYQQAAGLLLGVLRSLSPLRLAALTTTPVAPDPGADRDTLVARRGRPAGPFVRVGRWREDAPIETAPVISEVVVPRPEPVSITTMHVVLDDATTEDRVCSRLRSRTRGALSGVVELADGPIGTADVLGSSAALVDLSGLAVAGSIVSLTVFIDTYEYLARAACELVAQPTS